jgi:hypothetical protein
MIIEGLILKRVIDGRRSKKELKKQTKLMKEQNKILEKQQQGDPNDWRTRNPHSSTNNNLNNANSKTLEIGGTDLYGNRISEGPLIINYKGKQMTHADMMKEQEFERKEKQQKQQQKENAVAMKALNKNARIEELRNKARAGKPLGTKNRLWYAWHEDTEELKITNKREKQLRERTE